MARSLFQRGAGFLERHRWRSPAMAAWAMLRECYRHESVRQFVRPWFPPRRPSKWIFVVGCYNSGTTLTQQLISGHPLIRTLPWEGSLITSVLPTPEELGWTRMWIQCPDHMQMPDHSAPEEIERLLRDWAPWWGRGGSVFLEKSITNGTRMAWLDKHLSPACFVFVTRDAYCAAEGIRRKARPKPPAAAHPGQTYSLEMAARQWLAANQMILDASTSVERFLWLRYEDIVADPVREIARVWDFAELPAVPMQMHGEHCVVGRRRVRLSWDENARSRSRLTEVEVASIQPIVQDLQKRFGYERGSVLPAARESSPRGPAPEPDSRPAPLGDQRSESLRDEGGSAAAGRGQFVISFDLELGWGSIENGQWRSLQAAEVFTRTRTAMRRLLDVMDDLEIAATWGVVCGLALEPAERHLEHLPKAARDIWYEALSSAQQETFDGRDLVEWIAHRRVGHQFCCHTYSHFRWTHPLANEQIAGEELRRSQDQRPSSLPWRDRLIFPQNRVAFLNEVRAAGFSTVRASDRNLERSFRGRLSRWWALRQPIPASRRELVFPGVYQETDSLLFHTGRKPWRLPWLQHRAEVGLQRLAKCGAAYHVWLHPFDLGVESGLLEALIEHLKFAAKLRDQDELSIRLF